MFEESLTPWLTGAGARSAEGTDIGHENAEGMAYVGVRVEPTVRLGSEVEGGASEYSVSCLEGGFMLEVRVHLSSRAQESTAE